jgi:hypothetical protein
MTKSNQSRRRFRKRKFLKGINEDLQTKGNVKNTMLETSKELLITVIGGGLLGAAIGKPSLVIGLLATGTGLMAANGFQNAKGVNGLDGLDGVKERVQAYKENFSEKLYLDKIIKSKTTKAVNGVGALQYFDYQPAINGGLEALEQIENQILESGRQYQQMTGVGGAESELESEEEWEERLY